MQIVILIVLITDKPFYQLTMGIISLKSEPLGVLPVLTHLCFASAHCYTIFAIKLNCSGEGVVSNEPTGMSKM